MHLLLMTVARILFLAAMPSTKPAPAVSLHQRLTAERYAAVPLENRDQLDFRFVVSATVGGERLNLLLDTGAWAPVLDIITAVRLGLERVPNSKTGIPSQIGLLPANSDCCRNSPSAGERSRVRSLWPAT